MRSPGTRPAGAPWRFFGRLAAAVLMMAAIATAATVATAQVASALDPAAAPGSVRRAVFRAERARGQGDLETARLLLDEALAGGPDRDHPALRYRLGAYLCELGRAAEALPHLRRAAEEAPQEAPVWRELGRAAYETGSYAEAAAAFTRAVLCAAQRPARQAAEGAGPAAPDSLLLYYSGVAWILADRPDSAVSVLAPLVAAIADTVPQDWVRALVSAAASAARPQAADAGVARLLGDHPQQPAAWRLASQQAQLAGYLPLAAARLRAADWLEPLPPDELPLLAELQVAAGAPRLAARSYARALAAGGGRRAALIAPLAAAWLQAHEPDSARVVLQAELSEKQDLRLFMLLGDLEYSIRHWGGAAEAYRRAADLDPGNGRAWLMLGACAARRNRHVEAREHLQRALADSATAGQARSLLDQLAPSRLDR